ncbi:glycoside hydrolase family 2 protein [Ferrimonas pelagia]|uniref:glycoside hydrolase family 2 protein n=1 Tax=Ferrimonas pelagia TaxID=1177826 RepID=UPI0031E7B5C5
MWQFSPLVHDPTDLAPVQSHFDASHWPTITVPGNWYPQGYDLAGRHWYRRAFTLSRLPDSPSELVFEGVDYSARVWLNGHFLGQHSGFFAAFSFEVSTQLQLGQNWLVVEVDSPLEQQEDKDWSLNKRLIKGVLSHHDTRPGGAWSERGQEQNTGGIWGDVRLQPKPPFDVAELQWHSQVNQKQTRASVEFVVAQPMKARGQWQLELISGSDRSAVERYVFPVVTNDAGARLSFSLPWAERRLWWPREMGEAALYELSISYVEDGVRTEVARRQVGFREIYYDGQRGQWFINHQRVFLRGTNYIPTLYLAKANEALLAHDLALMAQANVNIVRVHAMVLPQRFYRMADRLGMMVWQDFPLQWGYVDEPSFTLEAQRQARLLVSQFGHHPSVVTWSGHNEPPWDADWMQYVYSNYQPDQNRALDEQLYLAFKTADPSRPVFAASLTKEHPWLGWYSGSWQDYGKPAKQALITEYGAQALPDLPVWAGVVELTDDLSLPDDWSQWEFHNFQRKETFELAGVSAGKNVAELIDNSQKYQARLIRYAAESLRRQKYQPVGAIFQFMLVEHWPSANWGVLDHRRNPKPGYEALQTAYQPVMPSIMHEQASFAPEQWIELPVYLLNDLHQDYLDARLTLQLYQGEDLVAHQEQRVDLMADTVQQLADFAPESLPAGRYQLRADLYSAQQRLLGYSKFEFEVTP